MQTSFLDAAVEVVEIGYGLSLTVVYFDGKPAIGYQGDRWIDQNVADDSLKLHTFIHRCRHSKVSLISNLKRD